MPNPRHEGTPPWFLIGRKTIKRFTSMQPRVAPQLAKKPARLVTVALANKLARTLWAMMKTGKVSAS